MFDRIAYTWSVMGASWQILRRDKELLLFPLVSFVACAAVLAAFLGPMVLADTYMPPPSDSSVLDQVAYYGPLFALYLCNYTIIVFFNAAIAACAVKRMAGGNPTLGDGLAAAASRLPHVIGWAVVAATVGVVLRIIEDRWKGLGRFVAGLLGTAWSLATFLVVPVLVVERCGPLSALKRSAALLRRTWGEQVIGEFSFGVLFILLALPALLALGAAAALGGLGPAVLVAGPAAVYLVILGLVYSVLMVVFQSGVYLVASGGQMPEGFEAELFRTSSVSRR